MMRGNGVIGGSGRLYGMPSTARNAPPWSTEVGFGAIHGPPPPTSPQLEIPWGRGWLSRVVLSRAKTNPHESQTM